MEWETENYVTTSNPKDQLHHVKIIRFEVLTVQN